MTSKFKNYYYVSMICFIITMFVHGAGYVTNYLYAFGWLMWLPAIVLVVFAVIQIVRDKYVVNRYIKRKKIYISTEFILLVITGCYVIFNVIFNCYILRNGGGQYTGGVYYLINLGERIKEISAEEYTKLLLAEYRMFSGHVLVIYALVLTYFRIKLLEETA